MTGSRDNNIAVVARLWNEGFNQGELDQLRDLASPEFVNFGRVVDGPAFLGDLISAMRFAFPDMAFETRQTVADDDWVITKARWTGTFVKPFPFIGLAGAQPTRRSFAVDHAHAFRCRNGKIAEHWAVRDDLTMHAQLGIKQ